MAGEFVASHYDVKKLIRAIVLSRAYQSSSISPEAIKLLPHFACMPVRRLSADQLYDSLVQATGFYEPPPPRNAKPFAADSARVDFRNKFAEEGKQQGERQTSIVQALALMNGKLTTDATGLERSKTLNAAGRTARREHAGADRNPLPGHTQPAARCGRSHTVSGLRRRRRLKHVAWQTHFGRY